MDLRKSSVILVALVLVSVAGLLAVVVAGVQGTNTTATKLDRSSTRNECARQVNADLDEAFRHNLTELLFDAFILRDAAGVERVLKRMNAAPNAADEINKHCPAPIAKGK